MLTGTPNQVEWAEQIRRSVALEFDRVAKAFEVREQNQAPESSAHTRAVIAIIQQKRAETMARTDAGYFIRDWQELSDQVRQMIFRDPRYQEMQTRRRVTGSKPGPAPDGQEP